MEDLIKAKQEHENTLLEKFRELLNTKKRKIRDQQRLLADAKLNPRTGLSHTVRHYILLRTYFSPAARVQEARGSSGPRKSVQSRQGKRKANGAGIDEDVGSEEDGFEDMDVDGEGGKAVPDALGREETPDKSDLDETEDEAVDDNDTSPSTLRQVESGVGAKGKAIETVKQKEPTAKPPEITSPPPRRELPFTKKDQGQTAPKDTLPIRDKEGESDDETDDDEL